MKTRRNNPSAVDTQFEEWAKAVAHGLTRRKTLQLIGGTFTGALLALRVPKSWAAPTTGRPGCGRICAPLFNRSNQTKFDACTQACEDCKTCHGSPGLSTTSPQVLVCTGATPCRSASGVACCGTGQNGQPLQTCCNSACCTGTCCGSVCCSTGMDCCTGNPPQVCYGPCTAPFERDPATCACVCPSGTTLCGTQCVAPSQCCNGNVCPSGQTCIGLPPICCPTANACTGDNSCCSGPCVDGFCG